MRRYINHLSHKADSQNDHRAGVRCCRRETLSLARLLCFVVAISLIGSACAQPAVAFDDFSDFLGDVFRGITGQKKKAAAPVILDAAMQFPAPAEKEMEKRKKRLEGFAAAQKNWIHSACELTDEQNAKFDKLVAERIQASQERRKKGNVQQRGLADYAPVQFTFTGAVNSTLDGAEWDRKVVELLTDDQSQRLSKANDERSQSLRLAQRDRILNIIDTELFFTSEQRPLVAQHIEEKLSLNVNKLYSLTNQTYYLRYESPQSLLNSLPPEGILNPAQKDRWTRVLKGNSSGAQSERYITFMSNDGVDGWYKTLDEALNHQAIRLTQAANVRIEYFTAEFELAEKDVQHLKLAAKGTIIYCMQTWKKSAKQNLQQWEERMNQQQFGNGNFGFSVAVPSTKVIEQHELWTNTLSEIGVDSTASSKDQVNQRQAAKMGYIISLLDRELWLTPKQRVQFQKVLASKLPKNDISGYEYMYEVVLLAIPLVRLSEADVKKILTPEQIVAWSALKTQYAINGQVVTINMQNQGQFNIRIPN